MPNNYTSFAARDHRPYLKTGVQDPIDQAIPEGYQVMRRQANEARTHVSVTSCWGFPIDFSFFVP